MKNFRLFSKHLSVKWKFVIAFFIVLILPVILTGFYLYHQVTSSSIAQARLVMEQNLEQTEASILHKQKVIENISSILAYNRSFYNFLDFDYYEDPNQRLVDYQFNYSPLVENILRQNEALYSIRIYADDFIVTEMLNSYYSISKYKSPQWFDEADKLKPSQYGWISSHIALKHALKKEADEPQVFSYNQNIHSTNYQQSVGVLEIEIKESVMFDMLRDPVVSNLGNVFIVDGKNKIVSDNIPQLFNKDVSESGFMNYRRGIHQSTVDKVHGEQAIVISIPVQEIGCSIVGIFPVHNFNGQAEKSLRQIMLVLSVSSIILGIVIYIITSALLRRLKRLVKAMKQVRNENLDVSVPVESMDEFGELAVNFNRMTGRIHELVEDVYKIRLLEREAELKALEAQINPHFLYNTLATIGWVARKGNSQEIVKMANSLGRFYRLVLSKGGRMISVKEELDMVMAYIYIQKVRFEDTFDVIYKVDESIYDFKLVKNILQPLVENAINHGIEPKRQHGTIIISIEAQEDKLVIEVIDDGVGMEEASLNSILKGAVERSKGSGYAVKNIMERLKRYYGEGCQFRIFSRRGIGTAISIMLVKNL